MVQWEIKGKSVLVTGGASGLGAEFVKAFLKDGAKNVAILDIAEEVGKAKTESLNKIYGDKVIFIRCDVSKEEDITKAFDAVVAEFKQVDVIINNAGKMCEAPNMWRTTSLINWQGTISFALKGIQHMRQDEGGAGGTIINLSSVAGITRYPYVPTYSGSKIAILHFTQCISMPPFYEQTGVRMLTICPGATDTPIMQGLGKRGFDSVTCRELESSVANIYIQKVESVVSAFVHMFKNGTPGSIWLAAYDKPVLDITPVVDSSFKALEDTLSSLS